MHYHWKNEGQNKKVNKSKTQVSDNKTSIESKQWSCRIPVNHPQMKTNYLTLRPLKSNIHFELRQRNKKDLRIWQDVDGKT